MNANSPLVSVIMAAYNAEAYIEKAIRSIRSQSFKEWELLVVDDASKDKTAEIARIFVDRDERIKLISKQENSGVVDTRNLGIQDSKGKYIAVLDSDDVAFPKRLELQFNFMENHPDHVLIGAACQEIDSNGTPLRTVERTVPNDQLSSLLLFSNYFINSTVMIRKRTLDLPAYLQGFQPSEDYELFCRLSKKGKLANLDTPLVYYRIHDQNISGDQTKLKSAIVKIHKKYLKELHIEASEAELKLHFGLAEGPFPKTEAEIQKVEQWLLKLVKQNEIHQVYQVKSFLRLTRLFFMRSCARSRLGLKAIRFYFRSDISGDFWSDPKGNLIFIMKTLYRLYGKA